MSNNKYEGLHLVLEVRNITDDSMDIRILHNSEKWGTTINLEYNTYLLDKTGRVFQGLCVSRNLQNYYLQPLFEMNYIFLNAGQGWNAVQFEKSKKHYILAGLKTALSKINDDKSKFKLDEDV